MNDPSRRTRPRTGIPALAAASAALGLALSGVPSSLAQEAATGTVLNATSEYRELATQHARETRGRRNAPPRGGRMIYGHWTPYDPPDPGTLPPEWPTHVIAQGDTLWDLSATFYQDPLLWPYLWEANPWILDPHWIYPGDVLAVPPLMLLPPGEPGARTIPSIADAFVRPGHEKHLYCGHFIADTNDEAFGEIIEAEADPDPVMLTLGDVVYLDVGSKDGVLPGDEFAIVYPRHHFEVSVNRRENRRIEVVHPITSEHLGYAMHMVGRLKVILLGEDVSTARITQACDAIELGYDIHPFAEVPMPLQRRHERIQHVNELAERGRGFIVYVLDDVENAGLGMLVSIDLGTADGVLPGDTFTVYRTHDYKFLDLDVDFLGTEWDRLEGTKRVRKHRDIAERDVFGRQKPVRRTPPRLIGELVVLYAERHTATAIVQTSELEFVPGDKVIFSAIPGDLTELPGRPSGL